MGVHGLGVRLVVDRVQQRLTHGRDAFGVTAIRRPHGG
jgi:hypothetical protein